MSGLDLILAFPFALEDEEIDCVQDHVEGLIEEGREGLRAPHLPFSLCLCGTGNEQEIVSGFL